ncbi:MAG: DNA-3-methyladenine glycosylase I [Chloroflexi bacterium]|nr:DNA-3-methyladenine glycosylase I [Chloroflexota bacterium]
MAATNRCAWAGEDPLMVKYHDEEWGTPLHDDRALFEFLILEGAQAGLSWITILRKREGYREAFDNFDASAIAEYGDEKVLELLANQGIIRNKLKVAASITNARLFLEIQKESGSFDAYLWGLARGETVTNKFESLDQIPATTDVSDAMSKAMKKRGFKFHAYPFD